MIFLDVATYTSKIFYMRDYEDDEDKARREYLHRRKSEIFWEIEDLWQAYLREVDFPKFKFSDYVSIYNDPPLSSTAADYRIWVWKFMRSYSPMHQN